jgi:hypothetical protein
MSHVLALCLLGLCVLLLVAHFAEIKQSHGSDG